MKRNELTQLLPVLQALGIDPSKIREEIVRQFDLPKAFNDVPVQEAPAAPGPATQTVEPNASALPAEALSQQLAGGVPASDVPLPEQGVQTGNPGAKY